MKLHQEVIEAHGLEFNVTIETDYDSGLPWNECEGYGPVREGSDKHAGEHVLYAGGRGERSYMYDWAEAMKIAKRDGWGPKDPTLTPRQNAARAVQKDFDFLKAWCDEEWVWCGVCVELADYSGPLDMERSLWSVEYWQYKNLTDPKNAYLQEIIAGMTQDLAKTYEKETTAAQE